MRSTFAGFNTAQLAMAVSQRALDVTGQNLANINTEGYTRQRLDQTSISPEGANITSSVYETKVGQGVQMTDVTQIRDQFLDVQYRNQLAKVGTFDAQDTILASIGDVFDETDKDAVCTYLNNIISQLSNMASTENAGTSSSDTLVRSACEVFLNVVHQNANDIQQVQDELVQKLEENVVPDINTILTEISNLNESIRNSQIVGNPALELQDQRNDLIDELATYFPIDVEYTEKNYGGGITVNLLDIYATLEDGTKVNLVSDAYHGSVQVEADEENGVPVALYFIDTDGYKTDNISDSLENGVIKSDLDMLNKSGVYDGSDTNGIGYYIQSFNDFINTFATTLNELNMSAGGGALFETSDGSDTFTAMNVKISSGWLSGETSIHTQTADEEGSTAYTNVLKMISALSDQTYTLTDADGNAIFTGTLSEMYTNLWNTQAIERQASSTLLTNHTTVLNQIADSKDSVSGVSMDEEATNLMRYQQSYNAAARLMTTYDEMLEKLITGTGVVGR